MLYREIMAVCSEIHTKHINTLCGQNVECCNSWCHIDCSLWLTNSCFTFEAMSSDPFSVSINHHSSQSYGILI